jgi:predicted methyltransferase
METETVQTHPNGKEVKSMAHVGVEIIVGDCRKELKRLPDGSVQCCVTSPPYW